MAKHRMDIGAYVGKLLAEEDTDVLREGIRVLAQVLMDSEVSSQIGAELYERTEARTAHRNGDRTRVWDTRVGVRALGMEGISRSEASRICKALDAEVEAFRTRAIEGEHPYLWLDATFHKVR